MKKRLLRHYCILLFRLDSYSEPSQVHTALGYQRPGFDFVAKQREGKELTPLLRAPHVLHRRPGTLPAGTAFSLAGEQPADLVFDGFGKAPNGDVTLGFRVPRRDGVDDDRDRLPVGNQAARKDLHTARAPSG